jgi:hypothetical protein
MNEHEFIKLAFDLLAASQPSAIADERLWREKHFEWLMEYRKRVKEAPQLAKQQ